MPKRTNDFQELIVSVYEQITPDGGKVTESEMVFDKDAGALREVDILVEYRYAHHDFKVAIECRDRSRKESVEWIDGLIGKAKALAVNKIVAVSKAGFSATALKKAQAHGIDTLTIEEAMERDWEKYPIKPGITVLTAESFSLQDVMFKDDDRFRSVKELNSDSTALIQGEEVGSLKEVLEYFFLNHLLAEIKEKVSADRSNLFKTKEDLTKTLMVETDHTFIEFTARLPNGFEIDLCTLKFIVYGTRQTADIEPTHIKFNDLMVSTGQHQDSDGTILKFNVVQDIEAKKIHCKWIRKGHEGTESPGREPRKGQPLT